MEVQYASENLAIVLLNQRRFAEAARLLEGTLRPMEGLASIDPANADYQKGVSNVLAWFAEAERAQGRFDSAIAARKRQIALLHRLAVGEQSDVAYHQNLVPAHQALGVLLTSRGEIRPGVEQYRLALSRAKLLMAIEPNNSSVRDVAASVRLELARNLLRLGRTDEAAQEVSAGCELAISLRARDPTVARWRALHTTCLEMRSRVALSSGAAAQALTFAEQALDAARAGRSGDPITDRYRLAAVYRLLGDVREHMGDRQGARAAWGAGLAQAPANVAERSVGDERAG
jgi:tetratricopeptide (TPR) repeat protein